MDIPLLGPNDQDRFVRMELTTMFNIFEGLYFGWIQQNRLAKIQAV